MMAVDPMTDPEKKPSSNPLLKAVVVCLLVLYVVLAGYLMYTNQNIGNTQLGYSSLLAENLTDLQRATSQLVVTLGAIHDDQKARAAVLNNTISELQSRVQILNRAMEARATSQAKSTQTLAGDVARTEAAVAELRKSLQSIETEDQHTRATLQEQLNKLQAGLAATAKTVDGQSIAIRQQLQAELAQVRQELGQTTQTIKGQTRRDLLAGLITENLRRISAVQADVERAPADAHQVWERARVLSGMCRLEQGLGEQVNQLDTAAAGLEQALRTSIVTVVARQEQLATAATDLDSARTAWVRAGTLLRYYPLGNDQQSVATYQGLVLAHEGVRQSIQRKFTQNTQATD